MFSKKLLATGLAALMLTLSLPFVSTASTTNVLEGSNADFDFVYKTNGDTDDISTEMANGDTLDATVFDTSDDTHYLYMGLLTQFDTMAFNITSAAEFAEGTTLTWEYRVKGGWAEVAATDNTEMFSKTGVQTVTLDELPSDWKLSTSFAKERYWLRAVVNGEVTTAPTLEQMSAVAYNVELRLKDQYKDPVTVKESQVTLSEADDTTIYGFQKFEDGVYRLALQTEADDIKYRASIDNADYDLEVFTIGSVTGAKNVYNIRMEKREKERDPEPSNECTNKFIDVKSHWALSAVTDLYCRDVVEGYTRLTFEPNKNITRAEFLKIALENAGVDVSDFEDYEEPYTDVNSGHWYRDYVTAAYYMGLIDHNESFRAQELVNRAEAVTILVRLADATLYDDKAYHEFTDVDYNEWYGRYLHVAVNSGVVEGYNDGSYQPGGYLTRGEAAVMANNAFYAWE